jgi:hypothetical protein
MHFKHTADEERKIATARSKEEVDRNRDSIRYKDRQRQQAGRQDRAGMQTDRHTDRQKERHV